MYPIHSQTSTLRDVDFQVVSRCESHAVDTLVPHSARDGVEMALRYVSASDADSALMAWMFQLVKANMEASMTLTRPTLNALDHSRVAGNIRCDVG